MAQTRPENPKVSVVMAAYNEAGRVDRAIQSIVDQTLKDWEIIFINDASTDETERIVADRRDPRITIRTHSQNQGIARSRNEAIGLAHGKYIAIFDADDFSYPERLERQVRFLESRPEIVLCGTSGYMHANGSAKILCEEPTDPYEIRRWILRTCPAINSSIMARADILKRYPYEPSLGRGEDHDLFIRIAKEHLIANLPEPLIEFETSSNWRYRLVDQWWKFRVRWRALTRHGCSWTQSYWLFAFIPALMIPERFKVSVRKTWISSVSSPFLKALGFITGSFTFARLGALAAQVWAGKALGAHEYGAANIVIAISALLQIGLMLGFPLAISKHLASGISEREQQELVPTALVSLLIWDLFVAAVLFLTRGWVGEYLRVPTDLYALAIFYACLSSTHMTISSSLQGLKRFKERGQVEALYGISVLIFFCIFFVIGVRNYSALIGSFCGALGLCILCTLWFLRDFLRPAWSASALKKIGSYSVIGVAAPLAMALTVSPARIILSQHFPLREVGILSAYFTSSVQIALAFLYVISTVLIPTTATADGQDAAWKRLRRIALPLFLGCSLLFCCTSAGALLVYGQNYPLRWDWVALFGVTAAVILLHGTVSSILVAQGLSGLGISATGSLLAGVGNLALNHWLTPRWGIPGAGLSLALSYSITLVGFYFWIPKAERT